MKFLIFIFAFLVLVGCESPSSGGSVQSGSMEFKKICVDGVQYLFKIDLMSHRGFMAPHLKPSGLPHLCE